MLPFHNNLTFVQHISATHDEFMVDMALEAGIPQFSLLETTPHEL